MDPFDAFTQALSAEELPQGTKRRLSNSATKSEQHCKRLVSEPLSTRCEPDSLNPPAPGDTTGGRFDHNFDYPGTHPQPDSISGWDSSIPSTTGQYQVVSNHLDSEPSQLLLSSSAAWSEPFHPLVSLDNWGYGALSGHQPSLASAPEVFPLDTFGIATSLAELPNDSLWYPPDVTLPYDASPMPGDPLGRPQRETIQALLEVGFLTPFGDEVKAEETEIPADQVNAMQPEEVELTSPPNTSTPACEDERSPASQQEVEYDCCFGAILSTATSSVSKRTQSLTVSVTVSVQGDILKLAFEDDGKHAGILISPTLGNLHRSFPTFFTASLTFRKNTSGGGKNQLKMSSKDNSQVSLPNFPSEHPVRVVVYGMLQDKDVVGDLLDAGNLFLQHPSASECDLGVTYFNPHYLLRPGAQMPSIESLSISTDQKPQSLPRAVDEVTKCRLMRLFDGAHGGDDASTIQPSPRLRSILKDYQLVALAMMADKERGLVDGSKFPSLWEVSRSTAQSSQSARDAHRFRHRITGAQQINPTVERGGVLADEMGLGKTLSVLSLICWSLDQSQKDTSGAGNHELDLPSTSTLVITPNSTIYNWKHQINSHIYPGEVRYTTFHGESRKLISLKDLHDHDVVLTTYGTLKADWSSRRLLFSKRWHRVVLDEAHTIRSRTSQVFRAACSIEADNRWCLTGTPIHNSLDDYGSLLAFIGVPAFATKPEFDRWITALIKDTGGHTIGMQRLKDLVRATCLRRTKLLVGESLMLPPRSEAIEHLQMGDRDQELYAFFNSQTAHLLPASTLQDSEELNNQAPQKRGNVLTLINVLRQICNHGPDLLPPSVLRSWTRREPLPSMGTFARFCFGCSAPLPNSSSAAALSGSFGCFDDDICPRCVRTDGALGLPDSAHRPLTPKPTSAKVGALRRNILKEVLVYKKSHPDDGDSSPTKSVVFSFWRKMLDLVQAALAKDGLGIVQIDGQSSLQEREKAIERFRNDASCRVMLATIGSAGEGVDFSVANHVHLLEPHWNPMIEAQAVDRVHRIGQTREVHVTRYIIDDSIETYVRWIQQDKQSLIDRCLTDMTVQQADVERSRWQKLREVVARGW